MTGTLKVSTQQLRNAANAFESKASEVQNLTRSMTNAVNRLNGSVWSGNAANAYKNKFRGLEDDINRMIKMIREHAADLKAMAAQYDQAENQNQSLASGLNNDVIH